jgi:hypothetical protein
MADVILTSLRTAKSAAAALKDAQSRELAPYGAELLRIVAPLARDGFTAAAIHVL